MATATDTEQETKVEAKADAGLNKLFAQHEVLKERTGKSFSAIIDYVEKYELSAEIIKLTLMERGLTESSAKSEASRIRGMLKEKNAPIREKLASGEITVRAAREAIATPQENPASAQKTPLDTTRERLEYAAKACVREPGFVAGVKEFTTLAAEAYNSVREKMTKAESDREAKKAAKLVEGQGNGDAGDSPEPE